MCESDEVDICYPIVSIAPPSFAWLVHVQSCLEKECQGCPAKSLVVGLASDMRYVI